MNRTSEGLGLGWLPDHPDFRDFSARHCQAAETGTRDVPALLGELKVAEPAPSLPPTSDLRSGFSPIEDQAQLGSCTANAGVGIVEYFERVGSGRYLDASRLFLWEASPRIGGA